MKKFEIDAKYQQFYVADSALAPDLPDYWSDEEIDKKFVALESIVALWTEGNISARIICIPPGEKFIQTLKPGFEAIAQITVSSGQIGIYEWPWDLLENYSVEPGVYNIKYSGYKLELIDSEDDFYVIEIEPEKVTK